MYARISKVRRVNVGRAKLNARKKWALLRSHVKREARTKALFKRWYAPPMRIMGKRGSFQTGGGPGYRLAHKRSGRYFKK